MCKKPVGLGAKRVRTVMKRSLAIFGPLSLTDDAGVA
jgi:hypothetical protein